ncbi:MAG: 50S ribosomal protein L30 [Euryarchaeota archaeon]|nr:50S ribosomal protein L30 [Euryarchaeota archaeon]
MTAIAVVRIRGHMRLRGTIEDSMRHMSLTRANHCVVLPDSPEVLGMVQHAKDYITWGRVSAADIENLIKTRGRLVGDKPITDEGVAKHTTYKTIQELAVALHDGKARWSRIEGFKPIFRLSPPKKGFKGGTKRSFAAHGNLGNRGKAMPELLARMI